MSILVVGSVAFDALQTPFGKIDKCLGGSATYFSVAASFFTEVDLVAVVGKELQKCRPDFVNAAHISPIGGWPVFCV